MVQTKNGRKRQTMIENTLDFYIQLEKYIPLSGSDEQKRIRLEAYANRLEEYLNQRPEKYSLDRLLDVIIETYKFKDFPLFATILDKLPLAKVKTGFDYDEQCASLWIKFTSGVWLEFVLPKGMPKSTAIDLGKKNYKGSIDWVYCPAGLKFDEKREEIKSYES